MRNSVRYCCWLVILCLMVGPAFAQYNPGNFYQYGNGRAQAVAPRQDQYQGNQLGAYAHPDSSLYENLQYDDRDAEGILREQLSRSRRYVDSGSPDPAPTQGFYDNFYEHRIYDEGQVGQVMAEARSISTLIKNKNNKPFVVIDKRNYQFYLYDSYGRLLRIGPVAIGKGRTDVGAFETPVGIFPIRSKIPVDDWIRPDWYFVEEGEPIPKRWEDRRVPGFFRYKLIFDGARYIHYAEATGGRLTHGCLGLDWHDAEAVFHTLEVGSHCIIVDPGFLARLAKGEFPINKPPLPKVTTPEDGLTTVATKGDIPKAGSNSAVTGRVSEDKVFRNLW